MLKVKYARSHLIYSVIIMLTIITVGIIVYIQNRDSIEDDALKTMDETQIIQNTLSEPEITQRSTRSRSNFIKHTDTHECEVHIPELALQPPSYPGDLEERLENLNSNGNSYYTNDNYFQELYDVVSKGLDMNATIKILKEYGIYTDVVLDHMDDFEAFEYIINHAPTEYKFSKTISGDDIKYAKRVISQDPKSDNALKAGLYIARMLENVHEKETYYRGILKHHPDSSNALYELGSLILMERPEESIGYFRKALNDSSSSAISMIGIAHERLGDYKSAWIYYKKALKINPLDECINNLEAIQNGEPHLYPILKTPSKLNDSVYDVDLLDTPLWIPHDTEYMDFVQEYMDLYQNDLNPNNPDLIQSASNTDKKVKVENKESFFKNIREKDLKAQESYFKSLYEFIDRATTVEQGNPIDFNDFLSEELQRHLLLKQTTFEPERITRGFKLIKKYGEKDGLKRLRRLDPSLADKLAEIMKESPKL